MSKKAIAYLKSKMGDAGANGALSCLAKGMTAFSLAKSLGYDGDDDDGDDDDGEGLGKSFRADKLIKALRQGESNAARPTPQRAAEPFDGIELAIEQAAAGEGTALLKSLVDGVVAGHAHTDGSLDELSLRVESSQQILLAMGQGLLKAMDKLDFLGQQVAGLRKSLGEPDAPRAQRVVQQQRPVVLQGGAQGQSVQRPEGGLVKSQAMSLLNQGMAKAIANDDRNKLRMLSDLSAIVETAHPLAGVDENVATQLRALAQ